MGILSVGPRTALLFALAGAGAFLIACGEGRDDALPGQGSGQFEDEPVSDPEACVKAESTAERPPVDIIVSVDRSGSMVEEIRQVRTNLNKLAAFLDETGLDYRVVTLGTTGKGEYDVCIPPPLGGADCGSNGTTYRAVSVSVTSYDTLRVILRTLSFADGERSAWKDFLRPSSVKVFVPVTDDDSREMGSVHFDYELLARPDGLFGSAQSRRYTFYPIVGAARFPSRKKCNGYVENAGEVYLQLAELTHGKWLPICAPDFSPVFEEIGRNVAAVLACELPIPPPPTGEEIEKSRVNVKIGFGDASTEILQDNSAPCSDGADGWQYDPAQTKIILCGPTCESVRSNKDAKVKVLFGCKTRVR